MRLLEKIAVVVVLIVAILLIVSFIKIEKPFTESPEQKDTYQQEWSVEFGDKG